MVTKHLTSPNLSSQRTVSPDVNVNFSMEQQKLIVATCAAPLKNLSVDRMSKNLKNISFLRKEVTVHVQQKDALQVWPFSEATKQECS